MEAIMRDYRANENETPTPLERAVGNYLKAQRSSDHLTPDEFFALAERGKRAKEYNRLMSHIMTCSDCRRTLLEMKSIQELASSIPKPKRALFHFPVLAPVAAVAVVIALLVLWWGFLRPAPQRVAHLPPEPPSTAPKQPRPQPAPAPQQEPPSRPTPPAPAPKPPQPTQRPSGSASKPQPPSRPAPRPEPPAPKRIQIAQNLFIEGDRIFEGGRPLPPWAHEYALRYQHTPPIVRSHPGSAPTEIRVTHPPLLAQRSIEDTQPVFKWEPVEGASEYLVKLYRVLGEESVLTESDIEEIPNALTVEGITASVGQPLEHGKQYLLTISALVTQPETQQVDRYQGEYRFYVLTETERERLDWARQNARTAPLTSAMIHLKLGYYEEAIRLLDTHARDSIAQKWLEYAKRELVKRQYNPTSWE